MSLSTFYRTNRCTQFNRIVPRHSWNNHCSGVLFLLSPSISLFPRFHTPPTEIQTYADAGINSENQDWKSNESSGSEQAIRIQHFCENKIDLGLNLQPIPSLIKIRLRILSYRKVPFSAKGISSSIQLIDLIRKLWQHIFIESLSMKLVPVEVAKCSIFVRFRNELQLSCLCLCASNSIINFK